jgi:epoxyqueuosine reductase
MMSQTEADLRDRIFTKAKGLGASLAGIASVAALQRSPSYGLYHDKPYYDGYEKVEWPAEARSVLVLALRHRPSEPALDWWADIPGKTPGNHRLMKIAEKMEQWLDEELGIDGHPLPYRLEHGGILLKDSAALAGVGAIGKNNLVITPEYGPRVRLRGLFLDRELDPTGPADLNPCDGCDMPCRRICPQRAFRDGSYNRTLCDQQMTMDFDQPVYLEQWMGEYSEKKVVKYCRACELACPVGRSGSREVVVANL